MMKEVKHLFVEDDIMAKDSVADKVTAKFVGLIRLLADMSRDSEQKQETTRRFITNFCDKYRLYDKGKYLGLYDRMLSGGYQ